MSNADGKSELSPRRTRADRGAGNSSAPYVAAIQRTAETIFGLWCSGALEDSEASAIIRTLTAATTRHKSVDVVHSGDAEKNAEA